MSDDPHNPDPDTAIPQEIARLIRQTESVIWVGRPRQLGPHAGLVWGGIAAAALAMVLAYVLLLAADVVPVSRTFDLWSAPLIIGLVGMPFALVVMAIEQSDARRRARTTYVLTTRHGYVYEDGIHADPSIWPIKSGKNAPILAANNDEWALLFKWQEHKDTNDTNAILPPGFPQKFTVWGEGFFDIVPDAAFLERLGAIGISAIDPRSLEDPNVE